MGFAAPPNALTKKQFDKAIAEDKRTLKEIDPALYKWQERNRKANKIGMIVLAIGTIILLGSSLIAYIIGS